MLKSGKVAVVAAVAVMNLIRVMSRVHRRSVMLMREAYQGLTKRWQRLPIGLAKRVSLG